MYRARKRKDKRAPFFGRWLRRRFGLEQLCDSCSRPYLEKTAAEPIDKIVQGSVVAEIFVEKRFGRLNYYIHIGRFGSDGSRMFISSLLAAEQLEEAAEVASRARAYIREPRPLRLVTRK
jgi:hypothetical protein